MITLPMFQFRGYTLRPAEHDDLPLAAAWTAADFEHRETTKPDFWIEQTMNRHSFVLENAEGTVFFFRMDHIAEKAVEIHIQFAPDDLHAKSRTIEGLTTGWAWLEKMLAASGFETVYFKSRNPRLMYFCQKRLGFINGDDGMQRYIPSLVRM